jgi:hypothetical protein
MLKKFANCLTLFGIVVIIFSMVVYFKDDLWKHFAWNVSWASQLMALFYNINSYNSPFADISKLVIVIFAPILVINYICFNKITIWHK